MLLFLLKKIPKTKVIAKYNTRQTQGELIQRAESVLEANLDYDVLRSSSHER